MYSLSLFLLVLVLIYIPSCLSEQCFSQTLKPSYPCCTGNKVVYTDKDGKWGVENGKWCGIDNDSSKESDDSCFSVTLGYPCCKSCKVLFTDKDGKWGVENKKWCGIKDNCSSTVENIKDPVQNVIDISKTDFEFSFLKMENNKKNMVYSPLSIKYALNMLQEGASNNTYAEINKVIGNLELPKYPNNGKILSLANSLFVKNRYYNSVKTEYMKTLNEKYDAEVKQDEFKNAKNINQWIEDKTLGIIKDMVKDKLVQDPDVVMLIINALAIDMEWIYQFSFDKTRGEAFYMDNGQKMTATMMFLKEISSKNVAYYMDDDITVLTMDLKDYDGTQLEFMAIMPNENLSDYINNISKEQINQIDKKLKFASDESDGVNIRIPKFKFDYDLGLKQDLKNLGIRDAFDLYRADFSNMSNTNDLFVSDAFHKADIEFTEKGVKAAAVTVIVMMTNGTMIFREKYPVNIIINKPFMFVIRDKKTKEIWFTGTVYEPNSWENDKSSYAPSNGL